MLIDNTSITEPELRQAYKQSGLWRDGWSFEKAINTRIILTCLRCKVNEARKRFQQQTGKPAPLQQALI
jgi:hypothetical protein